jgi:hypothetical protein
MSGNYVAEVIRQSLQRAETAKPGTVSALDVLHDDWCAVFKGRDVCNCNPEVRRRV